MSGERIKTVVSLQNLVPDVQHGGVSVMAVLRLVDLGQDASPTGRERMNFVSHLVSMTAAIITKVQHNGLQ